MPADILGTSILQAAGAQMIFRPGPVFTDFLLVDEINRMPPRTQSALLECMEERQVTSDTERRPLPEVFTVFATQNPDRFRRHISAAGGAARSLSHEDSRRLSNR